MQPHRILFIDAYDSFSNSIIALLRADLRVPVECIKIDDPRFVLNDEAFFTYLDGFSAVVAGPGPGHPASPHNVGLIGKLWTLPQKHVLPVLGICLGFQSLCHTFGAAVRRLKEPRHGIIAMMTHCGKDVFSGAGKVVATQYHSLHVQLEHASGQLWEPSDLWRPSAECPELIPLCWELMNVINGPILTAARHSSRPLWGVQYHPESICTNKEGKRLIRRWWEEACAWRTSERCTASTGCTDNFDVKRCISTQCLKSPSPPHRRVKWSTVLAKPDLDAANIVEQLRAEKICEEPLLLESGTRNSAPVNSETGRFSIIALQDSLAMQIRYSTNNHALEVLRDAKPVLREQVTVHDALECIDQHVRSQRAVGGSSELPFWGGFVGFISYEAGLASIDVAPPETNPRHPDIWFVFVERSIVIDHVRNLVYVQSVRPGDEQWLDTATAMLNVSRTVSASDTTDVPHVNAQLTSEPRRDTYLQNVRDCQSQLRAGESYELCLTDQSTFRTAVDPWSLYRRLRNRNPAPFGAYLCLQSCDVPTLAVAGSSPERFLSWSREGKCQFRPIKGTVKKVPDVTRARAEEILGSPKERAENLMIVDLIRHDLSGVPGVTEVRVPKLMSIEEYQTVFQLVSVIEGDLEPAASGATVLAASLPPGSMTGAPKKRSCELLKEIEGGQSRGVYSGVIGYFDVGGGGDFSVVIRTAYKWEDEDDEWRIGAGGAITALSEPQAEWDEMITKRESVLNALL